MDPVGFAGPTADALDDISGDHFPCSMACRQLPWQLLWQLGSFWGFERHMSLDSYHTASPNEEQWLGWHVRWVSDVVSFIALFWIWTIKICTFSVLQISDLWCFCWRSSRRSLFATAQYNTMQQINHNVTCGNVQHSFCKAPSPDIIQFLMFWTMSSESNLVCNKWILLLKQTSIPLDSLPASFEILLLEVKSEKWESIQNWHLPRVVCFVDKCLN